MNALASVGIEPTESLERFFHDAVQEVVEAHRIDGEQDTVWYLGNLLTAYSRSQKFFDHRADGATLTPLAEYYRHALEAQGAHERRQHLQRLGDVALFISSLFSGALNARPVGVNYYISMGENAYSCLAEGVAKSSRDRALEDIFADLANQFSHYVAALSDIPSRPLNDQSLVQTYEEWERTGHPALARRLRLQGVVLDDDKAAH